MLEFSSAGKLQGRPARRPYMKKRILLVDDEPAFARMMKFVLEKTGIYEVFCENDARSALTTVRACHPDLILLDVVMPHMDGRSVAAQLQIDPELKNVPIIFLTALASEREAEAAMTGLIMGMGPHFLGKLTKEADLLKCIAETIEQPETAVPHPVRKKFVVDPDCRTYHEKNGAKNNF